MNSGPGQGLYCKDGRVHGTTLIAGAEWPNYTTVTDLCDDGQLSRSEREEICEWLARDIGTGENAARQIYDYLFSGLRALSVMPTQDTFLFPSMSPIA